MNSFQTCFLLHQSNVQNVSDAQRYCQTLHSPHEKRLPKNHGFGHSPLPGLQWTGPTWLQSHNLSHKLFRRFFGKFTSLETVEFRKKFNKSISKNQRRSQFTKWFLISLQRVPLWHSIITFQIVKNLANFLGIYARTIKVHLLCLCQTIFKVDVENTFLERC